MKITTIIVAWFVAATVCPTVNAGTAGPPSASRVESQPWNGPRVPLVRVASSPFAGAYCGYLGGLQGATSISADGSVSGLFRRFSPSYNETLSFSGTVTQDGIMRLKVIHSIAVTVRGSRRGRTSTQRYTATLTVALDENRSLVGTSGWGAPFVWEPCQ